MSETSPASTAGEKPQGFSLMRMLTSIGPAILVASVVLGPGSIFTNSNVGAKFGYEMVWLLALATFMLVLTVFQCCYIGVYYQEAPLKTISSQFGRPLALATGLAVFLITCCFQFANNVAIIDVFTILSSDHLSASTSKILANITIVLINLGLITVLYGNSAYKKIEVIMKLMVAMMLIGFIANLIVVKPSINLAVQGLIPHLPKTISSKDILLLFGLVGTTLSYAGAFYQIYAVKEKKWTLNNLGNGLFDTLVGVATIGTVSLMIMLTSATVLKGVSLDSVVDVSKQLEPLIGPMAKYMFSMGLFAATISSLLVNTLIGGTVLVDGIGKPCSVKDPLVKIWTAIGLILGMLIAMTFNLSGMNTMMIIVTAQAFTVIGVPLVVFCMFLLTINMKNSTLKTFFSILGVVNIAISFVLAGGVIMNIISKLNL